MIAKAGASIGTQDVWMNGYLDDDPAGGKVSYLGGHAYTTTLPISSNPKTQGTRYFLNSLFEAPCSSSLGDPNPGTAVAGATGTNSSTTSLSVCFDNPGPGIAFGATLVLSLPTGVTVVSGSGGTPSGNTLTWNLESIAPDASGCFAVTVELGAEGSYAFTSTLNFSVGLSAMQVQSTSPLVVTFGHVNLLRYGGVASLAPLAPSAAQIFLAPYPVDPTLDPARDVEKVAFASASAFSHDASDLLPSSPPLIFYQLQGSPWNTLRVSKASGAVVVSY